MKNKNRNITKYRISRVGMDKRSIYKSFKHNLLCTLAKDKYTATNRDNFISLAIAIRDRLMKRWIATQQRYHRQNKKRVYYLSMEFLIGRLLSNNILNLGIQQETRDALEDLNLKLEDLQEEELDAGLGNGGLGRLAACFLDSMAALGIPSHGYGIRYDYGIFQQRIINGRQVELPEEWLKFGYAWEFARSENIVTIHFGGNVEFQELEDGRRVAKWVNTQDILALPFDIPISGYKNNIVNTLRLWSARGTEDFDFEYFNHGDYERAVTEKIISENISKALYPNDSISQGRELRLKQEYFFTAASIADIIRRFKEGNEDIRDLPKKVTIQLNDTHPALAILELMRILIDQENLAWDLAWDITLRCFAYTNHTLMPEALESWSVPLFERLLPRHLQLVYEINAQFLEAIRRKFPKDDARISRMSLVEEGEPKRIRMAYLCIVCSHSVNGVSELHSQLIKAALFKDFYEMFPKKFNNKTNGVTHRRWLLNANPKLADLISHTIGDKWITDLYQLEKLLEFKNDSSFLKKWQEVKSENKRYLAEYLYRKNGIIIDPDSMFDVQVKRMHEYKRQLLFTLYIIAEYLKIKHNPDLEVTPRTFMLGGKAAPGYFMAKLIIKFINNVSQIVNNEESLKGRLKLFFLENYCVSLAGKIFPASDLSEQISTAGTEASGTGCMKLMMNGALTIGTLDGANIEIAQEVGDENIFTFGLKAQEIHDLKVGGYNPNEFIERSAILKEIIGLIRDDFFSPQERGIFEPILQYLITSDHFFICADFDSYLAKQEEVGRLYRDGLTWYSKALVNVAKSGKFSSDRTVREYAKSIWKVQCKY